MTQPGPLNALQAKEKCKTASPQENPGIPHSSPKDHSNLAGQLPLFSDKRLIK